MKHSYILKISAIFFLLFGIWISFLDLRIKQFRNFEEADGTEFYTVHFLGLIESQGRQAEWHNVTTEDGYILSIFRILPNQINRNVSEKRRVIYLQHPLAASADIYVLFGPGRSLAYTLSDAGYDVWLGNFRGNFYSRRHKTMSPENSEFWNFSMDEYALLDTPAMFDYILETTEQPNLTYIGYSLGTTTILMLLSGRPEYNHKLDAVALLGPVSYWKSQNPTRTFITQFTNFFRLLIPSGVIQLESNVLVPFLFKHFCSLNYYTRSSCSHHYQLMIAKQFEYIPIEEMKDILCYFPAGVSVKVFYHYAQHVNSGRFHRYEYESKNSNSKHYEEDSSEYNVNNIITPIIMFHAPNDPLSTEEDVETFINKLPSDNRVIQETVQYEKFNHGDFIFDKNAEKLVYHRLLEIIEKFHSCGNSRL